MIDPIRLSKRASLHTKQAARCLAEALRHGKTAAEAFEELSAIIGYEPDAETLAHHDLIRKFINLMGNF